MVKSGTEGVIVGLRCFGIQSQRVHIHHRPRGFRMDLGHLVYILFYIGKPLKLRKKI
jgi:hypothetical protein